MRTSRKLILTRLLSLVMVFTMVIPMLTVGAAAEDLHDHTEYNLDNLTSDFNLESWTAERDAAIAASEAAHDHDQEVGWFESAVNAVADFFDMSDVGVTARAGDYNCPLCGAITALQNSSGGYQMPVSGPHHVSGCPYYTSSSGSSTGGSTTTTTTTVNVRCDICGASGGHTSGCPYFSSKVTTAAGSAIDSRCSWCHSTSHQLKDCPLYKGMGTEIKDVKTCSDCGVTVSATIDGVTWSFPHEVNCAVYKEFWDDVTENDDPQIVSNGAAGTTINGVLVAGSNFDPSKIGTGGGGVLVNNDQGFSNRVSQVTSNEATVLTYPRTVAQLQARASTGDPEHDFYDDPDWKTIMAASGGKGYSSGESGIWTYGGSKYRIAEVTGGQYVLVRLPSDWDSRLTETNPKARGNVATPTGTTTTQTVTGTRTTTSTSTSQPKPVEGNKSVTLGNYTETGKPSSSYTSGLQAAASGGAQLTQRADGTIHVDKQSSGDTKVVTDSKGNAVLKDGKVQTKTTTKSTSTSSYSYSVPVHYCSYSYYFTDVCKSGGTATFTGDYSYNVGNSNSYQGSTASTSTSTGKYTSVWDTGTTGATGTNFNYVKKSAYTTPVYTTQPVVPGTSTMSTGTSYGTNSYGTSSYDYLYGTSSSSKTAIDPYTGKTISQSAYNSKYGYDYNDQYTKYQQTQSANTVKGNTISVGNGNSYHVKTTFSCCSSNCGSVSEPHGLGSYTYTDMGPDYHRTENHCPDCGHITVGYEKHTTGGEKCTKCGRALGRNVAWHWYNSAEGPVITYIWTPFYSVMKYPNPTRGRQDYTFTGWYTDWGGQGQKIDTDREYLYVHIMPADFYADWAFMIQHDFEAPSIMIQYYESEAEALKTRGGQAITDLNKPVDEMWVKITTLDFEGHSVEAHKQFVGQSSTKDRQGTDHYKWHKDNPLWTSGLVDGVEDWTGSIQQAGEGPDTWHETPYVIKVTKNEPISVIARDAWGNTRTHIIKVTNFDEGAPVIEGFTQSNDSWTNSPVRVFVAAHDDQTLATQAYKWDYVLNSDTGRTVHAGTWTATPYFDMPDAGYVRVSVKDSVSKITESAPIDAIDQWYSVTNIDKIPLSLSGASGSTPSLGVSYEVSTTELVAASTGVTITLNIVDPQDTVSHRSSGLAPTPVYWEGLGVHTDWTTRKSVTVHQNGDIIVKLRDAVGNESVFPIRIGNIVTNGPSVSLSGTDVDGRNIADTRWLKGPVTLNAAASFGEAGQRSDGMSFSWDGGVTWTTQSTFVATVNGTYRCIVRDNSGTTAEATIYLGTVDSMEPVVGIYLYKGIPDDWSRRFSDGRACTESDYVWKLRIELEDPGAGLSESNPSIGSGLYTIQYHWIPGINGEGRIVNIGNITDADRGALGGTISTQSSTTGGDGVVRYKHEFDCPNPGTFQITVTDRSGNIVRVEKIAQWTDLGESTSGPNPNVPITLPDTGGGPSGNDDSQHGTAGLPYDANIEDLIWGEDTVYDTREPSPWSQNPMPYPANPGKGIPINFQAEVTRNRWATGYVTYNGIKYTVTFTNPDSEGLDTDISSFEGKANAKILGTGNKVNCHAFIPITAFNQDVRNARIYVTINEWDNEGCTNLVKTGSENLYTSVQKSKPTITYTYNRVTDTMTVVATSALSGIRSIEYQYDTNGWQDYNGPFVIGEPRPTTITLRATDNLGYVTELPINVADLGLNGSSGGVGSLPQNDTGLSGDTSSYHSSNRAADIYIIGGTRGNTDQHPAADVFNKLLGND